MVQDHPVRKSNKVCWQFISLSLVIYTVIYYRSIWFSVLKETERQRHKTISLLGLNSRKDVMITKDNKSVCRDNQLQSEATSQLQQTSAPPTVDHTQSRRPSGKD